jgi:carbon-monoxide dehydrogenase large subunit
MEIYTGSPLHRLGDARLLRGEGRYVADISANGMLAAVVVRSAFAHARILEIDASAALAHPGVHAVITAADLGSAQLRIPTFGQFPEEVVAATHARIEPALMVTLAEHTVRYAGEPLALVVADDRYVAGDAAELVFVDYDPLPVVLDVEAAAAPGAPIVGDDRTDNVPLELTVSIGNADAAFASAPHTVRERLYSQRYTGVPIESRGILACPTPEGGLTIWSSHQMPHLTRDLVCEALSLPNSAVRLQPPDVGGGFGPKAGLYPEDILIPFAARLLQRPVQWLEDKQEHLMASSHSREQLFDAELAFDDEGQIVAMRYASLIDAGAYHTVPITLSYIAACHMLGPYRIPAYRAEVKAVLTNKATSAPCRGAGRPEAVFVLNRLIDRAAQSLGIDPAEIRRRNLMAPEELPFDAGIPYRDGAPMVLDSGNYPEALERCLEAIGYDAFRREQAASRARGEFRGIGLACNVESTGLGPFEGGRVVVDDSGRVTVYTGVVDTGQGHATSLAQVCADHLGVEIDDVSVLAGDTGTIPAGLGTYHSRAAVTAGNAVSVAAAKVREKALDVAAALMEAAREDLVVSRGVVQVKGAPQRTVSLAECAQVCALDETSYFSAPAATWANACHAATVVVDADTGEVQIEKYVVVHDCGRMINPMIVDGQIRGGVVAGIGGALLEQLFYDESGQPQTTTLMDYMLPVLTNVPPLEVHHMESPSPLNPLGVKGAGEGGALGPPAVVAAAVEDALAPLGAKISQTPLSPHNVLAAIDAASRA